MLKNHILHELSLLCSEVHELLAKYYDFENMVNVTDFLMPSAVELGLAGQVCIEYPESSEDLFIGIRFGKSFEESFDGSENAQLTTHQLAVVAEEISHFQMLVSACNYNLAVRQRDLEMLGEIDRFLVLLHWNSYRGNRRLGRSFKNLHELCDHVFSGNRFSDVSKPLYFEAEAIAFLHLKKAFESQWDSTQFDFTKIDQFAQRYLKSVRRKCYLGSSHHLAV